MSDLTPNTKDYLVAAAKGVVGACPLIGSLAAEAIGTIIPNQRLDRVVEFLRKLEAEVASMDSRLGKFEQNVVTAEGIDIIEEGLVQAARSVSHERKERLARLVGRSLTAEEIKYEESKKLLNLLRDLTDPEVLWLIYYSMDPVFGPGPHADLVAKYPSVLKPISRELGAAQEQRDRAALQDSYKNTLERFGLIELNGRQSYTITALGRLMVRYIDERARYASES